MYVHTPDKKFHVHVLRHKAAFHSPNGCTVTPSQFFYGFANILWSVFLWPVKYKPYGIEANPTALNVRNWKSIASVEVDDGEGVLVVIEKYARKNNPHGSVLKVMM